MGDFIVFGAIILCFAVTLVFYLLKPKQYKIWEFFVPAVLTFLVILGVKAIMMSSAVSFNEYWGSYVTSVYEEEPYNEWITETCSRQVACGSTTDSNGNTTTTYCTEYYDCSHQDDYGPSWYVHTSLNNSISITEAQYDELADRFKSPTNVIKRRTNYASRDRAVGSSGSKFEGTKVGTTSVVYKTNWDKKDDSRQTVTTTHSYENRIRASDLSLFNISVVTEEEADSLGLYKYPDVRDNLEFPTILGNVSDDVQKRISKLNGKFGDSNQLRLWILLFENKPSVTGSYQENFWVRGNKNELTICIGHDTHGKIQWSYAFSWSLSGALTAEVKNKVMEMYEYTPISKDGQTLPAMPIISNELKKSIAKYNGIDTESLPNIIPVKLNVGNIKGFKKSKTPILTDQTWETYYQYLNEGLQDFSRREFDEFSYIRIELKTWQIILIYVLALMISIGVNIWASTNEFEDE